MCFLRSIPTVWMKKWGPPSGNPQNVQLKWGCTCDDHRRYDQQYDTGEKKWPLHNAKERFSKTIKMLM
jgi:hypothetical protein